MSLFSQLNKGIQSFRGKSHPATVPIESSTYTTPDGSGWSFSSSGSDFYYFKYEGFDSCIKAYNDCPEVNAVINAKAQAFINGDTFILTKTGKGKGKEATSGPANKLRTLFNKPNPLQSWEQFEAQMYIFVQLFGYCPILMIKPAGYTENIDTTSMWCIPPPMVSTTPTGKLFKQTEIDQVLKDQVFINWAGHSTTVSIKDIFFVKDVTPSIETPIFPQSRIKPLERPINNIIGAYESRNVLINYRGALGIFSRDPAGGTAQIPAPPITQEEKEALQKEFRRYGLRGNQWQFIITSANVKWQSISQPTKDLMLFEEVEGGAMAICNGYKYPYQLMAAAKGTTFSNLNEGKKLLYQDATIPEAKSIYSQFNSWFSTSTYNVVIDKDYSKVAVLQEDQVAMMQARYTRDQAYKIEWDNDLITLNQWRVANNEDPVEGSTGDMYKSQVLATQSVPLVTVIGVGGVQAAMEIINSTLPEENKKAALEIIIGMKPEDAARITSGLTNASTSTNESAATTETDTSTDEETGAEEDEGTAE